MRTLGEIIESAKSGGRPDYDELRLAVCALDSLSTFDQMDLRRSIEGTNTIRQMRYSESFSRWKRALGRSPKDWLGPSNDPDSTEYQERRKISLKVLDAATKRLADA